MVSALRKWWNRDYEARLADAKARLAAAPDRAMVAVDSDLVLDPSLRYEPRFQKITADHDIRLMKRAVAFATGKSRPVETGTVCEKCGQTGLAYCHKDVTRLLFCSHVSWSVDEFMWRRIEEIMEKDHWFPAPLMPGKSLVAGATIESIECGRNLYEHLRMRHCWFE